MSSFLSKWLRAPAIQFAMVLLCCVVPSSAQVSTATVVGTVEDSSSARIPDAGVKLINVLTGTQNSSTTDSYGDFVLTGVLPGSYLLQIDRTGFATAQFTGITLNIGDTKSFLVRMKVGSIDQTVVVDAAGMTLNNEDASVSTVVDQKFVKNLPLNGRSFQDLVSMTPGTITQSPQVLGQGDFSVNGQRPDTNTFTVDGISGNIGPGTLLGSRKLPSAGRYAGTTAPGTTQSLVSVDALQEFRVLGSTYSAEYGGSPGGQFSLLTRSGTSEFHGSAYDYVRNSVFDASDWFTQFNQASAGESFRQHDFGATFGGPVVVPKLYRGPENTFFFGSYERLLVAQPTAPFIQYVPSNMIRNGVPDALKTIMGAFPFAESGLPADTTLARTAYDSISLPSHVASTSIRVDHSFSPNTSAFIRFGDTPSDSESRNLSAFSRVQENTKTLTLGVMTQLSAARSNDFRFGYAQSRSTLSTSIQSFYSNQPTDLISAFAIPASYAPARAEVYIRIPGIGESMIDADAASNSLRQWNLRDTFALQLRHHLMRFGIDERRVHTGVRPAAVSVEADYFDKASLLSNRASGLSITKTAPASPVFNEFAAFVQDEWKVSNSVNLSFGLRWDIDPPPAEAHGHDAYTLVGDPGSPQTLTLAPRGTPLWHTGWHNVAPRIGAAWLLNNAPGNETVLRSGVGIYFDTANQAAAGAFGALGFSATAHPESTSLPLDASEFDFSSSPEPPYLNATVFAFPPHLQSPYTLQWNVALDRALGRRQVFTLSYVGADGRRLLQLQRRDIRLANPEFSEINFFPNGLSSNYQSLQARFQRSVSPGLQVLASYALSHTLDYGSTDPAFPLTYGNSDLDVRQNLQLALSWDEPRGSGRSESKLFGGWGIDARLFARTAFPITMLGNLISDPVTGDHYYSGVDLVPNQPLYLHGSQYPGGRAVNGGPSAVAPAFRLPDLSSSGDAPRNMLRGFGAQQVNLALRKEIKVHDRLNLQLRAETFNLFNHPDLGYVDPHLTDALSGQSTLMLNQSFGSTGSLYQQGGPRSVQLMLRLEF